MMRVYRLSDTAGIDGLKPAEEIRPTPGRGQVLVRMNAAALNYRDLMVATGRYAQGVTPAGLVPLSDGAGEVIEVGPEVRRFRAGDRVAGIFVQDWLGGEYQEAYGATALGGAVDGVLAEYRLFDQQGLVKIPGHLSFREAATLPCAGVTAWNALFGARPVQPGQSVLVLGTGGVSMFALQFARMAGARVIATSSSREKLDRALALGADDGIDYTADPEWQQRVLELTDGRGVDHVVEVVGGENVARSVQAVRNGGIIHLIGAQAGGLIDPTAVRRRNVTLRGLYVGSRDQFQAMNRAVSRHGLRPVIDRAFTFADAPAAFRYFESRAHFGKVVIDVAPA